MMSHVEVRVGAGAALALMLALTGCNQQSAPQAGAAGAAGPGAAGAAAPLPEVIVVMAHSQPVPQRIELSGRLRPFQIAEVRPQASGLIQKRLFTEGSYVRAGEPLYQLDSSTYQTTVNSAEASVRRQQASLNALQVKAKRYQELLGIQAVSRQEYDDIQAQIALAQADLAAAQASVANARINLNYSVVRAPISGQTGSSSVTAGALVTASQPTPLVTIQQLDPLYVDITQSSAEMLKLRQQLSSGALSASGQTRIQLILPDGQVYPIEGQLAFANASVDESTGAVTLRATIANPRQVLLPGMYVRARVDQGTLPSAMLIPQQAVTRTPQGEAAVLSVADDGSVSQKVIQVAGTQDDQWVVTSGLQEGEKIIVQGSQKIRLMPGMPAPKVKATLAGVEPLQSGVPATAAKASAPAQPAAH